MKAFKQPCNKVMMIISVDAGLCEKRLKALEIGGLLGR